MAKLKTYLLPIAIGAGLVISVWLAWSHYQGVLEDRAALRLQVERVSAENAQLKRTQEVLEQNAKDAVQRARDLTDIKREIYETPSTDVPDDIRRVLDRLRARESSRNP